MLEMWEEAVNNQKVMKLKELEKKYRIDFGKDKEMSLYSYLKKIGFKNLARLIIKKEQ